MLKRFVILFLLPFIICGCSRKNIEEITFSSWGSITEVKILKNVISDFEKTNPDIKVQFMHIPQNYFQKLHLLFASNTAPDVIFINNLYLPVYEKQLCDLSDKFDTKEFYPQSIEAMTIDGRLLAIPRDMSNFVLYYNKNYIKTPPKDFSEFDRLLKNQKNHYGISYERDIFYAEPYILTLGEKEGTEYYKNLEGKFAPTPANVGSLTQAQMFLDGKFAFYQSGRWTYPKLSETAEFPFGVTSFPEKTYADTSGWAISNQTKHRQASEKFVKYLASKQSIDYFTSTGLIVPARIDSSKKLDNANERAFLQAIPKSVIRKPDKNFAKYRDMKNKTLW